jgi:hypothetical protein
MRSIFLSVAALAVVSFAVNTVSAPAGQDRTDVAGFNYGGLRSTTVRRWPKTTMRSKPWRPSAR